MEDKRILSMEEFKKNQEEEKPMTDAVKAKNYIADMAYNNGMIFGQVKQFFDSVNEENCSEMAEYFFREMVSNLFFATMKHTGMLMCAEVLEDRPESLRMTTEEVIDLLFPKKTMEEGESDDAAPELPGRTPELHEDGNDAASDGRGESGVADAVRPGEDEN